MSNEQVCSSNQLKENTDTKASEQTTGSYKAPTGAEPRMLSADEVAELRGCGWMTTSEFQNLCYTVERLREADHSKPCPLCKTEPTAVEGVSVVLEQCHYHKAIQYWMDKAHEEHSEWSGECVRLRRQMADMRCQHAGDAEIARLAREWYALYRGESTFNTEVESAAFDALIAAVEQEGR